jgi:hypothetical protein
MLSFLKNFLPTKHNESSDNVLNRATQDIYQMAHQLKINNRDSCIAIVTNINTNIIDYYDVIVRSKLPFAEVADSIEVHLFSRRIYSIVKHYQNFSTLNIQIKELL